MVIESDQSNLGNLYNKMISVKSFRERRVAGGIIEIQQGTLWEISCDRQNYSPGNDDRTFNCRPAGGFEGLINKYARAATVIPAQR
jgi:hypothetical protein